MGEIPTVWEPSGPFIEGEYAQSTSVDIVDQLGVFIVDPSGNNIVDTGQTFTRTSATTWAKDDGA